MYIIVLVILTIIIISTNFVLVSAKQNDPKDIPMEYQTCAYNIYEKLPPLMKDVDHFKNNIYTCAYGYVSYGIDISDESIPVSKRLDVIYEAKNCMFQDSCYEKLENSVYDKNSLNTENNDNDSFPCGDLVNSDIILTSNLNCSTDGMIVGADGITIKLNGYTINGPGLTSDKVGIMVPNNNNNIVIMGPGTIQNFQAGILITDASVVSAESLTLQNNQIGVFTTGANNLKITENMIKNSNIGIAVHSTRNLEISNNMINTNNLAGITFVNSDDNNIINNSIGNSQKGLFIDEESTNNDIIDNNMVSNIVDINNANGLSPDKNFNNYEGNICENGNPVEICK